MPGYFVKPTDLPMLAALRAERRSFVLLAVLVLAFQLLLPAALAGAGGPDRLADLCFGLGDAEAPAPSHGAACICASPCFHGGCGAGEAPYTERLATRLATAAVLSRPVNRMSRRPSARLLPESRAPPSRS